MKLLRIATQNIAGVPDRTFDFTDGADAPLDVVLITGLPGSGKTRLLEAIIAAKEDVGSYGPTRSIGACVRAGARTARLEATWLLSPAEKQRARAASAVVTTVSIFGEGAPPIAEHPEELCAVFREHSCDPGRAKVEYFHAGRALPPTRGIRPFGMPGADADARLRLTTSNEKYRMLRAYVVAEIQADDEALARIVREQGGGSVTCQFHARHRLREALRPFLRGKEFDGIDRVGESFRLRFRLPDGAVLDLEELSASERQGVLFALTFLRLGLEHSVVLIDEPDLHVHAAERVRFLEALAALGRDNQIIAATGSTELVNAAECGHVVELSPPPSRDGEAPAESQRAAAWVQGTTPSPRQDVAQTPIEPPAAPAVVALSAPAADLAQPSSVPSYLQPPPAPPALLPPSALAPPRALDNEDEGTVELKDAALKPALPFVKPGDPGGRSNATEVLPAWGAAPPGKRLIRFDPQTGRPLAEPVWVDAPTPPVNRQK